MHSTFRVGVTPDFYEEVKGKFEAPVASKLGDLDWLEVHPMRPEAGNFISSSSLKGEVRRQDWRCRVRRGGAC